MQRAELLKVAKPILFNTEMVMAILEGRKTVTRRCVKPQPTYSPRDGFSWKGYAYGTDLPQTEKGAAHNFLCNAPYKVGDILYVRETWSEWTDGYVYKAWSSPFPQPGKASVMKWHPSLHMPKEAARIFLKVKDVRVKRLQNMNEVNTAKEGIRTDVQTHRLDDPDFIENFGGIDKFKVLWDSTINKSDVELYGWDANPYVWVIEFEVITAEQAKANST